VLALAEALTQADLAASVLPLVPDTEDPGRVDIDIFIGADELRPALAVQQLLQLCVDSAAIVVDSWDRERPSLSRDEVESILGDRLIDLTIVYLSDGSFLAKFSINPKTSEGRKRLFAIGSLTVAALVITAVIPPAALIVTGALPSVAVMLKPDAKKANDPVPLKTVDPRDVADANVHITVSGPIHVYDIYVDGPPGAKEAFLVRVHNLAGVEAQSGFVTAGPDAGRLLRVWSSKALDESQLRAFAAETATEIASITHSLTHH
jgi:hypothetical protein